MRRLTVSQGLVGLHRTVQTSGRVAPSSPQSHHAGENSEASKHASRHSSIGRCSLLLRHDRGRMHAMDGVKVPPLPNLSGLPLIGSRMLNSTPGPSCTATQRRTSTTFERSIPSCVIVPRRPRTIREPNHTPVSTKAVAAEVVTRVSIILRHCRTAVSRQLWQVAPWPL